MPVITPLCSINHPGQHLPRQIFSNGCSKMRFNMIIIYLQLLQLVDKNKSALVYEVDQIAQQYGHRILRLPPYHCLFNPIEHIWGITKNYYNRHVRETGSSLENSKLIWQEALKTIIPEIWRNTGQGPGEFIIQCCYFFAILCFVDCTYYFIICNALL